MRILILGDTHKERRNFMQAVDRTQPDEVWHMGDVEGDADFLREYAKVGTKVNSGNRRYYNSFDVVPLHSSDETIAHV